ncbi:zinc ribbon domain-containing protein [Ligilactobacillus equi]
MKDRAWTCPKCKVFHIRDHNAAKNILDKGHTELAKTLTENSPIYK